MWVCVCVHDIFLHLIRCLHLLASHCKALALCLLWKNDSQQSFPLNLNDVLYIQIWAKDSMHLKKFDFLFCSKISKHLCLESYVYLRRLSLKTSLNLTLLCDYQEVNWVQDQPDDPQVHLCISSKTLLVTLHIDFRFRVKSARCSYSLLYFLNH